MSNISQERLEQSLAENVRLEHEHARLIAQKHVRQAAREVGWSDAELASNLADIDAIVRSDDVVTAAKTAVKDLSQRYPQFVGGAPAQRRATPTGQNYKPYQPSAGGFVPASVRNQDPQLLADMAELRRLGRGGRL
jgi:hypothetical protein